MQRFLVGYADVRRQIGRTGVFLPVVTNLRFQGNAHCLAEMTAIHLPSAPALSFL